MCDLRSGKKPRVFGWCRVFGTHTFGESATPFPTRKTRPIFAAVKMRVRKKIRQLHDPGVGGILVPPWEFLDKGTSRKVLLNTAGGEGISGISNPRAFV